MEIVNPIITAVVGSVMVPVKKHIGYMISCTTYVKNMTSKLTELDAIGVDVENHMKQNKISNLQIPSHVKGWLHEVGKIREKVEIVCGDVGSCFNLKNRHRLGRKAFKVIEEIDRLIAEYTRINWNDRPIPLGKVDSMKASTSTSSSDHIDFQSREKTFEEALKALQPGHKSHMIALCGMGGLGKTTMMEKLKKVAEEKKLFNLIIKVALGENPNISDLQDAVADYLSTDLKEKAKVARADRLRKSFEAHSDGGKNKILVLLDDVWKLVDLNDIGLSPLPNQGVGFKFLLTSRDRKVCSNMGVEASSILNLEVLNEQEAESFFQQFVEISDNVDPDLHKIGKDIVKKCCGLPIAIKTIACALKDEKNNEVWEDTLSRLKQHNVENINQVFEISYNRLKGEETKSIFLLCGLFPEDFDIPTEDLVRYGWGLKLFNRVSTLTEARYRLRTCITKLIHTNFLIQSDHDGCVKMHDLVLAFVLDMFSKAEHASIVNHGNISEWPSEYTDDSYQRISLTCTSMSEFPRDCKYAKLSLLKLMKGYESLRFPEDFYGTMGKLQVIAYEKMKYPLLPMSLQCSTNLRTLCLRQCLLMFDLSPIGDLVNLEVLSFADCHVRKLPSTIGKLNKLKLLDVTGCVDLRIDNGVLKNLAKLEELYMSSFDQDTHYFRSRKAISFTDDNCNDLEERSKNLSALEIDFFENNVQPKNMSFEKLKRFKISMGCLLENKDHSFENTLRLVTKKDELLESRINELFEKTNVLHLQVDDMSDLEDFEVIPSPQYSSFCNIRVLVVSQCAALSYLFTFRVATALVKLEHLEISACRVMEALIHVEDGEEEQIEFPRLKFLHLENLPKLLSLWKNDKVIELPQLIELQLDELPNFTSIFPTNKPPASSMSVNNSAMQPFLNKEVVIPKLAKLVIKHMDNLKEIWPCHINGNVSVLRKIKVFKCDSLVNLFPSNPMSLLHNLEVLKCDSVEVLFNFDLGSVCEIMEKDGSLRHIKVYESNKLTDVCRIKGVNNFNPPIRIFEALEFLEIHECSSFRNVFTPTTANFVLGALEHMYICSTESVCHGESFKRRQEKKMEVISKDEISEVDDTISNVAFSHTHFSSPSNTSYR